jgi:hypothetical protein
VVPTVYTLTSTEESRELRACGGFEYVRKFHITPAPPAGGIIVQKIERHFHGLFQYASDKGKLREKPVLPSVVNRHSNPGDTQYWEVFEVKPGATEADDTDEFTLTTMSQGAKKSKALIDAIIDSGARAAVAKATYSYRTLGSFTQTGEAIFYETNTVPSGPTGFAVNRTSAAGLLPMTTTDPTPGLAAINHSAALNITLNAKWNSNKKGTKNYGEPTLTIT